MSRTKNVKYAKSIISKMDSAAKKVIADTGMYFFEEVIAYAATFGGFDSGQGLAHWNLKYYTSTYHKAPLKVMWGYKKGGVVHTPTDPVGYKSQNTRKKGKGIKIGPSGNKKKIFNFLAEKAVHAYETRPNGFTSFVVYNNINSRFPYFDPGNPKFYPDNVFGDMDRGTMSDLLKKAKLRAAGLES